VGSLRYRACRIVEVSNQWDRRGIEPVGSLGSQTRGVAGGTRVSLFSGGWDKLWTHHVISPAIEAMAEAIARVTGLEASDA